MSEIVRHRKTGEEYILLGQGVLKSIYKKDEPINIVASLETISIYEIYNLDDFSELFEERHQSHYNIL